VADTTLYFALIIFLCFVAVSIAIQIAQHDKQQSLAQKLGELQEKNREKLGNPLYIYNILYSNTVEDDSAVERDMQSVYSTLQKSMDEQYNHLRAEQQAQRQSIEDTRHFIRFASFRSQNYKKI
jgi:hypothetical protein